MIPNLKLYIYAAAITAVFLVGAYVSHKFSEAKIAKLELSYEHERTVSATKYAEAQAAARAIESAWQSDVAAREAAYQEAAALRDTRIAALGATNGKLRERITALSSASGSSQDPSATIRDLQVRVDAFGALLIDLDGMAGESAQVADTLREELLLCRNYVRVISDNHSSQ